MRGCTHGMGDQERQGTLLPVGKPGACGCARAMTPTRTRLCHGIGSHSSLGAPLGKGETLQPPHGPPLQGASYGVHSRWRDGQREWQLRGHPNHTQRWQEGPGCPAGGFG